MSTSGLRPDARLIPVAEHLPELRNADPRGELLELVGVFVRAEVQVLGLSIGQPGSQPGDAVKPQEVGQ
jgi:hypothetical protein